ncbi:hypothetical protein DF3PB_3370002 [uncultured Defluviicoccus sp.]|uniref:Uncharacterized protein n=1 Tax=metagenome TaxID=256318 RepID=A0A380TGL1_9ZZZZ|nr:hypothetical protein DF3PB_3370002 [uncultured Defluviicoccus sp.]
MRTSPATRSTKHAGNVGRIGRLTHAKQATPGAVALKRRPRAQWGLSVVPCDPTGQNEITKPLTRICTDPTSCIP